MSPFIDVGPRKLVKSMEFHEPCAFILRSAARSATISRHHSSRHSSSFSGCLIAFADGPDTKVVRYVYVLQVCINTHVYVLCFAASSLATRRRLRRSVGTFCLNFG